MVERLLVQVLLEGLILSVPCQWDNPLDCRCCECCHHFVPSRWMSGRSIPHTGPGRSTGGSPYMGRSCKQVNIYNMIIWNVLSNQTHRGSGLDQTCQIMSHQTSDAAVSLKVRQKFWMHMMAASLPVFFGDWPICAPARM